MSKEMAKVECPGYGKDLSNGAKVMTFPITPEVARETGREEHSFVFQFVRPAAPDDESLWQEYQRKKIEWRSQDHWVTQLYVSHEAAEAMFVHLLRIFMPDLVDLAIERDQRKHHELQATD